MKNLYKYLLFLFPLLFSCSRGEMEFVNFEEIKGADDSAFHVYSTKVTDLSSGLPDNCNFTFDDLEQGTKTTGTTIQNILSDLFEYNNKGKVIEIAGTYRSIDMITGEVLTLSGKVLLPKDRKPKRYIVVSHYTIGSNSECPSNSFPLEGVLCNMGYAMIFPDYQGYGVDSKHLHKYLVLHQTALDVCMMYASVEQYLANTEYAPENDDIYLMGFSQGGAVTMAVEWMFESAHKTKIGQVFAGGGPYDVRATYNNFITTNKVNIPVAVPLVIQGMIEGNGLDIDIKEILKPWIYEKLDEWINSKKYTTDQLKSMMGTTTTSDILTDVGMDPTSEIVAELYKAMSENSIIAFDWCPEASVYMFHSMDDDVVPFINASMARNKWSEANIHYNFGNYGSHKMAALRFIYSVKKWLKEEEE